jgi:hypothetical protein
VRHHNVIYRILRPALVAITVIAVVTSCGNDGGPSGDSSSNGVEFIDVTHDDGTRYRCLWSYKDGGYDGGAGLWCERINTTTTTEDIPDD